MRSSARPRSMDSHTVNQSLGRPLDAIVGTNVGFLGGLGHHLIRLGTFIV